MSNASASGGSGDRSQSHWATSAKSLTTVTNLTRSLPHCATDANRSMPQSCMPSSAPASSPRPPPKVPKAHLLKPAGVPYLGTTNLSNASASGSGDLSKSHWATSAKSRSLPHCATNANRSLPQCCCMPAMLWRVAKSEAVAATQSHWSRNHKPATPPHSVPLPPMPITVCSMPANPPPQRTVHPPQAR